MSGNGWKTCSLEEITENHDSRRVPVKETERRPGPYPYCGASGVVDHVDEYIFDGEYLLIAEDGENLRTRNTPAAFMANGKFWVNNHAHIVTGNHRANTRFLCYALANTDISGYLTGSTMPKLTQGNMNRILILTPPLAVQKAIAHILGTLDDKIELNRRMNETLEAMTRAIFKSWFVDFDPVRAKMDGRKPEGMDAATAKLFPDEFEESELGPIPKGWKVTTLGQVAQNVSNTFDFSSNVDVVFVNTGDVLDGDFLHSNRSDPTGLPGQAKKAIAPDNILLSEIRPANKRFAYVDFDASEYVVSTKFMVIRGSSEIHSRLLYRILTSTETLTEFQIQAESRSGTFPQITFDSVSYLPIVLPPRTIQDAYQWLITRTDAHIKTNKAQSGVLAALRDTLLPKLLSGEIRIKDADRARESAT